MNKYVITKQLTKRPEDYPDAKNQAHVQVAIRRKAAGKRDGVMQVCTLASPQIEKGLLSDKPKAWEVLEITVISAFVVVTIVTIVLVTVVVVIVIYCMQYKADGDPQ